MKIGIIETGLPPHHIGGSELQAWNLAKQLVKKHRITVFTRQLLDAAAFDTVYKIKIYRTKIFRRPFGIVSYLIGTFLAIRKEKRNLDLLLCFRAWPNGIIGLFVTLLLRIPACFSIRGGDWYFVEPKWWGKIIYKVLFASPMVVTVQSKKIRDDIIKKYPVAKPLIIPNGIEKSEKQDKPGKSLLFVGNLIPRKGVDVLIEAVKEIPDCLLMIVGDGPERRRLEKLATGFDITFYGRAQPQEVLRLMSLHGKLFILPALAGEGFPNVLLEAMSVGIPVIASDVAGVGDLLEDGDAGILVEPGSVDALRNAILSMMHDEPLHKNMAQAGYKATQKYCWEIVTRRWLKLFVEMIEPAASSRKN